MVFHSRETTAPIWVLFLYTLPQTHPLSPSLSLSLRIPRIPLRLWHLPHTTWFDEGNSLEHAFRERTAWKKKARGRERETKSFAVSANNWQLKIIPSYQTDTHTCHEPSRQEAKNNTDPLCPVFIPTSQLWFPRQVSSQPLLLEHVCKRSSSRLNLAGYRKVAGSVSVRNWLWSTKQTTTDTNLSCPLNAFHAPRTCCWDSRWVRRWMVLGCILRVQGTFARLWSRRSTGGKISHRWKISWSCNNYETRQTAFLPFN